MAELARPNVFLIGAPKCGTSAMFAHLCLHPDIFGSKLKEPHFFGDDLERLNGRRFRIDEYLGLFAEARYERFLLDGSTSYIFSRSAPAEIRAFTSDARAIVMLRDPVTVMHAFHAEMVAGGFEPIASFVDALDAEPDRTSGRRLPSRRGIRENLYYRRVVRFAEHLERWFEVLGRERVHVIFYEDWSGNTSKEYAETLAFLGAAPFSPRFKRVNPSRQVRSPRLHRFLFEPSAPARTIAAKLLPARTRNRVAHRLGRLNTRVAAREPVPLDLLARLRAELEPDIRRLEALLGRDLSGWR